MTFHEYFELNYQSIIDGLNKQKLDNGVFTIYDTMQNAVLECLESGYEGSKEQLDKYLYTVTNKHKKRRHDYRDKYFQNHNTNIDYDALSNMKDAVINDDIDKLKDMDEYDRMLLLEIFDRPNATQFGKEFGISRNVVFKTLEDMQRKYNPIFN